MRLPEGKGKATIVIMRCLGKWELKGAAKSDLLLKVTVGVEPVFFQNDFTNEQLS